MDPLNDDLLAGRRCGPVGVPIRPVIGRHYLRHWPVHTMAPSVPSQSGAKAAAPAATGTVSRPAAGSNRLHPGQAVTLRAKALSVLRITHGRVWLTLTDVGPYRRVLAGDHFLSRGESLTLLPGQTLVMESFGRGEGASAQFSWGPPGAPATVPVAAEAGWRAGVLQPLLELRHATGLAAGAVGRLMLGLGHFAGAEVARISLYVAMIFVADSARKAKAGSRFDTVSRDPRVPCRMH